MAIMRSVRGGCNQRHRLQVPGGGTFLSEFYLLLTENIIFRQVLFYRNGETNHPRS